ncbi:hypothetical protein [Gracilibacillus timonensis]|uniref:hypothetical protein n=1 Tax=Gracilibacillus timonensis TaxID=1816696 RepID=UPI0008267A70|nr:hypothetical protein [Gracilibacillus timonensis]
MKITYNDTEVNKMTEKEKLFLLIGRLNSKQITALHEVVSSMVSSEGKAYPEEELTEGEQDELNAAIKDYKNGKYERGDNLHELFS